VSHRSKITAADVAGAIRRRQRAGWERGQGERVGTSVDELMYELDASRSTVLRVLGDMKRIWPLRQANRSTGGQPGRPVVEYTLVGGWDARETGRGLVSVGVDVGVSEDVRDKVRSSRVLYGVSEFRTYMNGIAPYTDC